MVGRPARLAEISPNSETAADWRSTQSPAGKALDPPTGLAMGNFKGLLALFFLETALKTDALHHPFGKPIFKTAGSCCLSVPARKAVCRSGGAEDVLGMWKHRIHPRPGGGGWGGDIKGELKVSTGNAEETPRAGKEC